jgi:predicted O-methyltransferase YrrM
VKGDNGPSWPTATTHGVLEFGAYLAIHDPYLLWDYIRWVAGSRRKVAYDEPAITSRRTPLSPPEARSLIQGRVGAQPDGAALGLVRTEAPRAKGVSKELVSMAGDISLGELLYVLVRGLRPEVVIETGVAHGITSAYLLAGLADNGRGSLHSIDLPSRAMIRSGLVGAAVPNVLRNRWIYHWAPSGRVLPNLLKTTAHQLGLFVHDSDHRYANMRHELELAWNAAPEGAWIVADDVDLHSAFDDVCRNVSVEPVYVRQEEKRGWTGLMTKRPDTAMDAD